MAFTFSFAEYPVGDLSIITADDFSIDIHTLLHVFVTRTGRRAERMGRRTDIRRLEATVKAVIIEHAYQHNGVRAELVDNSVAGLCEVRPKAEVSLIVLLDADVALCRGFGNCDPDQPGQTAGRLLGHGRRYEGHPRAGGRIIVEAMPRSADMLGCCG